MRRNYQQKLLQEIIKRNYDAKLSASILYVAENVGIIGILAYPKTIGYLKKSIVMNNKYLFDFSLIKCLTLLQTRQRSVEPWSIRIIYL